MVRSSLSRLFEKYCETIFKRYKDKVKYWMTFNEINIMDFMPRLQVES